MRIDPANWFRVCNDATINASVRQSPDSRCEKVAGLGPQKGLVDLAASVADGHLIDWEALEADAQSEYDRRVIRELRLIAGMAELHRTHAEEEGAAPQALDQSEADKATTGRG